jgi:redox-sensitive bicupin YhaK (pirin superfamily)
MIEIRPAASIAQAEGEWFRARWHFSFDTYYDPANVSWGDLRVFNDDRLIPGAAWPLHPHRDIEGITYVAEGMFEHADSQGNGGVLPPGSIQRATLGSGMWHSEKNHSATEPMRFIQMWIMPAELGLEPSVEQRSFSDDERRNRLLPVLVPAKGFGGAGAPELFDGQAVTVHQDAVVHAGLLESGVEVEHRFRDGFGGYLFVVHGDAQVDGSDRQGGSADGGLVDEGGAAKLGDVESIRIRAGEKGAEILLVETRLERASDAIGSAQGDRPAESDGPPGDESERDESAA